MSPSRIEAKRPMAFYAPAVGRSRMLLEKNEGKWLWPFFFFVRVLQRFRRKKTGFSEIYYQIEIFIRRTRQWMNAQSEASGSRDWETTRPHSQGNAAATNATTQTSHPRSSSKLSGAKAIRVPDDGASRSGDRNCQPLAQPRPRASFAPIRFGQSLQNRGRMLVFVESRRGYRPVRGGSTISIRAPSPGWLGIFIIRHIAYIKTYIYNKRGGWKYVCYKCYRAEKKLIWNH